MKKYNPTDVISLLDLSENVHNKNVGQEFYILGYRMPFRVISKRYGLTEIACTITEINFFIPIPIDFTERVESS